MNIQHINHQPISKRDLRPDGILSVHSIFRTIQGEGPFCGHPAVFVRLQGCNLQCPGCDTEYTNAAPRYKAPMDPETLLDDVMERAGNSNVELIVITGGEPFRQNIGPFVNRALAQGYSIQIETNGTLAPPKWLIYALVLKHVTIVVSPKSGKVNPLTAEYANAYKYVLHHESIAEDGLPILALGHSAAPRVARPPKDYRGPVYLQPMDCQDDAENKKNIDAVVKSCIEHGYILQLQIHKYLGVE